MAVTVSGGTQEMGVRRAPLKTIPSDDFMIEDEGEKYYPHKGEEVTFKKRAISIRTMRLVSNMSELQAQSNKLEKREEELEAKGKELPKKDQDLLAKSRAKVTGILTNDIAPNLARAILDWTWTDMYDESENPEPLPKPTLETLRDLDIEEISYLLEKWTSLSMSSEEVPNPQ